MCFALGGGFNHTFLYSYSLMRTQIKQNSYTYIQTLAHMWTQWSSVMMDSEGFEVVTQYDNVLLSIAQTLVSPC